MALTAATKEAGYCNTSILSTIVVVDSYSSDHRYAIISINVA